jgi:hypothetical protein
MSRSLGSALHACRRIQIIMHPMIVSGILMGTIGFIMDVDPTGVAAKVVSLTLLLVMAPFWFLM